MVEKTTFEKLQELAKEGKTIIAGEIVTLPKLASQKPLKKK